METRKKNIARQWTMGSDFVFTYRSASVEDDTYHQSDRSRILLQISQRVDKRTEKMKELGVTFEKAGLYLNEYGEKMDFEEEEKNIIQSMDDEFYRYGLLMQGEDPETHNAQLLTEEDKTKLDEWFLGKHIYEKRLARLGKNPSAEEIETERVRLLRICFKALAREVNENTVRKGEEGEQRVVYRPWELAEKGWIRSFQEAVRKKVTRAIRTPEQELMASILGRGWEMVVREMKELGLEGVDFRDEIEKRRKLYDVLGIDQLKQELQEVREGRETLQRSQPKN